MFVFSGALHGSCMTRPAAGRGHEVVETSLVRSGRAGPGAFSRLSRAGPGRISLARPDPTRPDPARFDRHREQTCFFRCPCFQRRYNRRGTGIVSRVKASFGLMQSTTMFSAYRGGRARGSNPAVSSYRSHICSCRMSTPRCAFNQKRHRATCMHTPIHVLLHGKR